MLIFIGRASGAEVELIAGDLLISLVRVLVAYLASLLLGAAIAFLVTRSEKWENILLPFFDTAQSMPSLAILPVLLVWFRDAPEVPVFILLVITMIWPIVFSIISGIKNIRPSLAEAATIFGAVGRKRFFSFTLPIITPSVITGSIIGWGEGWEVLVAAELLGASRGIGVYIDQASKQGEMGVMTIAIAILMFFIFVLNKWFWIPLLKRSSQHHSI